MICELAILAALLVLWWAERPRQRLEEPPTPADLHRRSRAPALTRTREVVLRPGEVLDPGAFAVFNAGATAAQAAEAMRQLASYSQAEDVLHRMRTGGRGDVKGPR